MSANIKNPESTRVSRRIKATQRRSNAEVKRVAFNVTVALDKNIEAYALQKGVLKNQVFVEALRKLLEANAMQPDHDPIVSVSYR